MLNSIMGPSNLGSERRLLLMIVSVMIDFFQRGVADCAHRMPRQTVWWFVPTRVPNQMGVNETKLA